ncbi:glycosyltransferase family 4 protein [Thermoanaerobacterium saccharolyticum]|uniref:glycosyltransferase family 4 protein n=1 Tax=Thermoanaerobacterium saccharolyticum TaxID=28896 RepID=UPI002FD9CCB7
MKILYITQFFYPERTAGAIRAYENAINWEKGGNQVTVLTTYPNFPIGKIFKEYKNKMLSHEIIEGIDVYRSYLYMRPNTNIVNRLISYIGFPLFSIINLFILNRKYFKGKYDVIITTSGPIFTPIIGLLFSKIRKIPLITEFRDLTFKQILATKFTDNNFAYKVVRGIELFFARASDEVIVLTKGFAKILMEYGIDKNKIDIIPNGYEIKENNSKEDNLKKELIKKSGEIIISYFGTMGVSQNLFKIFDLISHLKEYNNIKFLFIGDGAVKSELLKYKEEKELFNLTMLDGMPEHELEYYYQISDYCLVLLNNDQNFAYTIPSKIFQIMGRKKPIIFIGPEGEASEIINSAKCGLTLYDNEIEILKNKILNFIKKEDTQVLGNNGYNFVLRNYNRKNLCNKYIDIINEKVLGGKKH